MLCFVLYCIVWCGVVFCIYIPPPPSPLWFFSDVLSVSGSHPSSPLAFYPATYANAAFADPVEPELDVGTRLQKVADQRMAMRDRARRERDEAELRTMKFAPAINASSRKKAAAHGYRPIHERLGEVVRSRYETLQRLQSEDEERYRTENQHQPKLDPKSLVLASARRLSTPRQSLSWPYNPAHDDGDTDPLSYGQSQNQHPNTSASYNFTPRAADDRAQSGSRGRERPASAPRSRPYTWGGQDQSGSAPVSYRERSRSRSRDPTSPIRTSIVGSTTSLPSATDLEGQAEKRRHALAMARAATAAAEDCTFAPKVDDFSRRITEHSALFQAARGFLDRQVPHMTGRRGGRDMLACKVVFVYL